MSAAEDGRASHGAGCGWTAVFGLGVFLIAVAVGWILVTPIVAIAASTLGVH